MVILFLWVVLAVLGVVLVPTVGSLRPLFGWQVNSRSPTSVFGGAIDATVQAWGGGVGAGMQTFLDSTIRRQTQVQVLGLVVNLTPAVVPYWGVERLLAIPLYLVPRAVWPNKPNLSIGTYFSIVYMGHPTDTTTSSTPTIFGDLYVSAGWGAVFVGMIIWGVISAWLYGRLKVQPLQQGNASLSALYLGTVISIADIEGTYVAMAVGLIQVLIVYGVLYVWLYPLRQASDAVANGSRSFMSGTGA